MRVTYLAQYAEIELYPPGTIVSLIDMPPEIRWHLKLNNGSPDARYINFFNEEGRLFDDMNSPIFRGQRDRHRILGDRNTWRAYDGIVI